MIINRVFIFMYFFTLEILHKINKRTNKRKVKEDRADESYNSGFKST